MNNLLNLGYEVLAGEVYRAVVRAHLDPYLGYLHSIEPYKLSLVCDIQEIFRSLIDDFTINYSRKLSEKDFERRGRRVFLKRGESYKLIKAIDKFFDERIKHQRIKRFGTHSKIRTAIREEPMKLAQYLRGEKEKYGPVVISKALL